MERTDGDVCSEIPAAVQEAGSRECVYAALGDHHRRHVLATLVEVETPERLSALTRSLAVETGRSGEDVIERLQLDLHHRHLPKLDAAGLVRYDVDRNVVDLTEAGRQLAKSFSR